MRPVLLEMTGFATFRDLTTVSFDDADFFALVGPTGAGKSTVIDGMTFALFGTVPRWDDRRTIALALAPTVARGTVRLVFDVAGQRYVVARELRRAANGSVSQKNARLERLTDATSLGLLDDESDSIAADSKVTGAVEDLLGLSFEHFVTCVVLPQGDFAQFLHEKPAERQRILVKLLGLGVYDTIGKRAREEAAMQRQRADLVTEQLGAYADATEEAEQAALKRLVGMEAMRSDVNERLPQVAAVVESLRSAERAQSALRAEIALLGDVRVPDELPDVDARRTASREALAAARVELRAAEAADDQAQEALKAAPPKGPLEEVIRFADERESLLAQLPTLGEAREVAGVALAKAAEAAKAAATEAEARRAQRDACAALLKQAEEQAAAVADEVQRLRGLDVPLAVDDLDVRIKVARQQARDATEQLQEAEAGDAAARRALAGAPARAPLEQARRDHAELAALQPRLTEAERALGDASVALAGAQERLREAEGELNSARAARDNAHRHDVAATLRPQLVEGAPCPVCEQTVVTLPTLVDATREVEAAEGAVSTAQAEEATARAAWVEATQRQQQAVSEAARLRERSTQLIAAVEPVGAEVDVAKQLDELDALEQQARTADQRLEAARAVVTSATAELRTTEGKLESARQALSTARDPLVSLGAPAVDASDLAKAWSALAAWAEQRATARAADLADRESTVSATRASLDAAEEVAATAAAAAEGAGQDVVVATRAEQQAVAELSAAKARVDELQRLLTGKPARDAAVAELQKVAALEQAAAATAEHARTSRTALRAAEESAGAVTAELTALTTRLATVRDPLVALGAPPLDSEDVLAAWLTLQAWAEQATLGRRESLSQSDQQVRTAAVEADELRNQLLRLLADSDVLVPDAVDVVAGAPPAVAAAVERATAEVARIRERMQHAADMQQQRKEAEEAQQVAHDLGVLLKADNFPRWLVSSALDVLVAEASATLSELSSGQYDLSHDDGEFFIVDHSDADSRRPVRTLSGGETFQASLALALSLSSQMSGMAAEGAARLDSIFLDEGFGTLDENTLDVVASTLENLAARGDRMVGIVTHVPALAERVPVRFRVTRAGRTSTVVREEA